MYFNIFSTSLLKHNTLASTSQNHQYDIISEVGTKGSGCKGCGCSRGHGRGIGRGGRGRRVLVRVIGRCQYDPYSIGSKYWSFVTESIIYPKEQWMALSRDQRESVTWKKTDAGWFYGVTPPYRLTLNEKKFSVINTSLISAIHENISNSKFNSTSGLFPLPTLPGPTPPIPPMAMTDSNYDVQYFVRVGTCQQPHSDSRSIASVSINGRP